MWFLQLNLDQKFLILEGMEEWEGETRKKSFSFFLSLL